MFFFLSYNLNDIFKYKIFTISDKDGNISLDRIQEFEIFFFLNLTLTLNFNLIVGIASCDISDSHSPAITAVYRYYYFRHLIGSA